MFFVDIKEEHCYQTKDHILNLSPHILKMCAVGTQLAHYLHNPCVIDRPRLGLHGIDK